MCCLCTCTTEVNDGNSKLLEVCLFISDRVCKSLEPHSIFFNTYIFTYSSQGFLKALFFVCLFVFVLSFSVQSLTIFRGMLVC